MCENLRNDKDDGPGDYNKSDKEEDDDEYDSDVLND